MHHRPDEARRRLDPDRRRGDGRHVAAASAKSSCASSACCSRAARCSIRCRVWENVAFGLIQGRGINRAEAKEIALRKLAAVGLGPEVGACSARPSCPAACRSASALARAIAAEPEIIFFDEPTTGLDPIMADVINELINQCVDDLGATALSITHDMTSARKIGDTASR